MAACAKRYLRRIGEYLLARVKEEKRRILNSKFEKGERLSTEQISTLTSTIKKDYSKYVDRDLESSRKCTKKAVRNIRTAREDFRRTTDDIARLINKYEQD